MFDLGISKLKTINTSKITISNGAGQPGTPSYQASEVILNQRSDGANSDM